MNISSTKILKIMFIVLVALLTIFIIMILFNKFINYGNLKLTNAADNSDIVVDGISVNRNTIKLKPGIHSIYITNKNYSTYYSQVKISLFKTTDISPQQNPIGIQEKINTALGFDESSTFDIDLKTIKEFNSGNTLAGIILQGGSYAFVVEYRNGWKTVYSQKNDRQSNLDIINQTEVREYIEKLLTENIKNNVP